MNFNPAPASQTERKYKYYDMLMAAFVTVLLCSNLIGASKVASVGGFTFGAGVLFFPLSYLFGDVLTEVYGYARSRKVVWTGFISMIFASIMATVVVKMPPAPGYPNQAALETIFGATPRIVVASLIAYFTGEFANSFTLAKMKVSTEGKRMNVRFVLSTVVGEACDSMIFYPLAFLGVWPTPLVMKVMVSNYVLKVLWEIIALPVTVPIVTWLKRVENEDYFDRNTKFTPFSLET